MTLYQELKNAGCEMDSHCSDLYVKNTVCALEIILLYENEKAQTVSRTYFRSEVDGQSWIDLPFQFTPYWKKRGMA